jgi:hypothetical protein
MSGSQFSTYEYMVTLHSSVGRCMLSYQYVMSTAGLCIMDRNDKCVQPVGDILPGVK